MFNHPLGLSCCFVLEVGSHFCFDYRKVNEVTQKDAYPLSHIDTTLGKLARAHWFRLLLLSSAVVNGKWTSKKQTKYRSTTFGTTKGVFQFCCMPFGLCSAPATFQHFMGHVSVGLHLPYCLLYIGNLIVLRNSFDDHL